MKRGTGRINFSLFAPSLFKKGVRALFGQRIGVKSFR